MICHIPADRARENYRRAEGILEAMEAAVLDDRPGEDEEEPLRLLQDFTPIYPKEEYILCPILRNNTLCFIWCLSGTVRHDNYFV